MVGEMTANDLAFLMILIYYYSIQISTCLHNIIGIHFYPIVNKEMAIADTEELPTNVLLCFNRDPEITIGPKYDNFTLKFAAIAVGNIMELYDFAVFGAVADMVGENFFPIDRSSNMKILQAFAVYGSAFFMRPIGGVLMGYIGDKVSRKRQLEISVAMMLFTSVLIGCLPTYSQIGSLATVLLVVLRLLQGIAVGGELIGALVYTLEGVEDRYKGFWGATMKATGFLGTTIGIGVSTILRAFMSEEDMLSYGWRLAFFFGAAIGLIGIILRNLLVEEPISDSVSINNIPIFFVLKVYYYEVALIFFVAALWCLGYYTCLVWMAYYMSDLGILYSWTLNFSLNLLLVIVFPMFGYFNDCICMGYQTVDQGLSVILQVGACLIFFVAIPAFLLIDTCSVFLVVLGQLLLVIALSIYGASLPAFMISKFPPIYRCTGMGIAYNLANAVLT